ncbi:MAG: IS110 family transposase [Solobacterium sp.]|nr:IS110 family transposase [Solobacterium sp.]
MRGPVITVDVSKGTCHYQPFFEKGKPLRKPKVLNDTNEGFAELIAAVEKLKEKSGCDIVPIIFEATGIYHRCLQKFLDDHEIPYYIISPLLSAAYRKTNLHGNKTDDLDCAHIAKAYYDEDHLDTFQKQSDRFIKLQRMNRYYEVELNHLRMRKVAFRNSLDIIYPRMDKCFKGRASLYDPVPMEVLKKYPHPSLLLKHKEETIVKAVVKKTDHKPAFVSEVVHKMYECAQHCYSGADISDIEVIKLPGMIDELQRQMKLCDAILDELIEEARNVPYFESIVSITGIGANLAARIIAELGDMSRFTSRRAIAAYAGLNPKILQSGDVDGTHLRISKKGNRHLRCLLYLGASCNYRLKKHDPIYEFNQKKRQQSQSPLRAKAANIAAAHKLLIIIYALSKSGELYRS